MEPKDGGPYHPCEVTWRADGSIDGVQTQDHAGIHTGASLRDHFAGLAMQGLLANQDARLMTSTEYARIAYEHADAMLTERERGR